MDTLNKGRPAEDEIERRITELRQKRGGGSDIEKQIEKQVQRLRKRQETGAAVEDKSEAERQEISPAVEDTLETQSPEIRQSGAVFCTQCGSKARGIDRFCWSCGSELYRKGGNVG